MEYQVTELSPCQRGLELTWTSKEVEEKLNEKLKEYKKDLALPGFRPGKAPIGLIKSRFGEMIGQELSQTLIKEGFKEAVEKSGIEPINQGKPDIISELQEGKPFKVKIEVEIKPEVQLKNYTGYNLKKKRKKIGKKDVENEVERLKEQVANLEKLDREVIQENDIITADMETKDREKQLVRLDLSDEWTGRLFKELIGVKVGEKKEVTVEYPQDYPAEELRGTQKVFKLEIREIFKKKYPESPKELLEKIGGDFKSYEQFMEHIKKELEEKEAQAAENQLREQVTDLLIKDNPVEPPPTTVEYTIARLISYNYGDRKISEDEYNQLSEKLKPIAERSIKKQLILEAIGKAEGLEVTDEEFNQWLAGEAERLGTTTDVLRSYYQENKQLESKKDDLIQKKAMDFVLKNSEITEEEIT